MMGFSHQTSWNSRTKTIFNGLVLLGNWIAENVDFKSCYHVDFPSNHVWGWWRWVHIVPGDRSWIIYGSFKEDLIDLCLVFQSTAERFFPPSNVSACCWLSVLSMFWPLICWAWSCWKGKGSWMECLSFQNSSLIATICLLVGGSQTITELWCLNWPYVAI